MTADCIGAPLLPRCRDARGAGSARHPAAPRTQPRLGALHRPGGGGVAPVSGRVAACPAACPGGPGGGPCLSRRVSRPVCEGGRSTSEAKPSTPEALAWAFRCDSGLSGGVGRPIHALLARVSATGPGMPRIGGVYAQGWRGAKFSGSRVPHSCSRAPRGMGRRAGAPVGRACGEVGWAAGVVASASGRVASVSPAVGAGGSGGVGPSRASSSVGRPSPTAHLATVPARRRRGAVFAAPQHRRARNLKQQAQQRRDLQGAPCVRPSPDDCIDCIADYNPINAISRSLSWPPILSSVMSNLPSRWP